MAKGRVAVGLLTIALALMTLAAPPAAAGEISFVDMFRSEFATQTGDGSSLSTNLFRFDTHLFSVGPGDFSAVQLTHPGPGSPASLTPTSPTVFGLSSEFPTQALMDAAFPFGTYTYNATGTPSDSTSFNYTADVYPASLPFLAGSDFSDLQGMNAAAPFTFHFSAFPAAAGANEQFIFFTIFEAVTFTTAFNAGFLPRTTTGITMPAGTLLPDHPYIYELIFSNRVISDSPGAQFGASFGFDRRTAGPFETPKRYRSLRH